MSAQDDDLVGLFRAPNLTNRVVNRERSRRQLVVDLDLDARLGRSRARGQPVEQRVVFMSDEGAVDGLGRVRTLFVTPAAAGRQQTLGLARVAQDDSDTFLAE